MPEHLNVSTDLTSKIIASLGRADGPEAWDRRLARLEDEYGVECYRMLLHVLTHLDFTPRRAKSHWNELFETWKDLSDKTGVELDLRVAVLHYFLRVQKKLENPTVVEIKFLQQAEDSVIVDELTGVYNFRYFQHRVAQEIKRVGRYDHGVSLLMIDVDDFKCFNDENGHLQGNRALRKIAGLLVKCVREVDVVCRYGGEEFAVILPATLKAGALTAAEKIRMHVARARFRGGVTQPRGKVSVSIGVATVPGDGNTIDELVARADAALYRAKALGKNRVEAFSEERREFVRFDASVSGKLLVLEKSPVTFTTTNVSQGGLLLRSRRRLGVGGIVQLELRLPGATEQWRCTARVVRVDKVDEGYEIGVEIIHVEGADIFRFQRFLGELQKRPEPKSRERRTG